MAENAALSRENPVATLVEKFKVWVQEQPEWLVLIQMERHERRAGMRELAQRLYTIPTLDAANTVPRVVRRKAAQQLSNIVKDQARKDVLAAVKAQEQLILQAAVELGREQGEELAMERQAVKQQVQEMIESGEISPEAMAAAAADQALLDEARASTALDGETQVVSGPVEVDEMGFVETDETVSAEEVEQGLD